MVILGGCNAQCKEECDGVTLVKNPKSVHNTGGLKIVPNLDCPPGQFLPRTTPDILVGMLLEG